MPTLPLQTLRKRSDFLRLNSGRRWAVPGLVLQMKPTPDGPDGAGAGLRLGLTVTKKIGNAVVRNRVRRRLRAAALEVLPVSGQPGHDYVLIARAGAQLRDYAALKGDIEAALRRVHRPQSKTS